MVKGEVGAAVCAGQMVDWEAVERDRTQGWDWDRIADDPKVGFHAEEGAGEPGRALRALYYQRRSKSQRRPGRSEGGGKGSDADDKPPVEPGPRSATSSSRSRGSGSSSPSCSRRPVGTYFPAIPWIGFILAVSAFVLIWGLLRTDQRWAPVMRTSVIAGVVLGLVIVGGFALVAELNNCPTLSPIAGAEPQGWERSNAPAWTQGAAPVFLFVGSIACPYCSASSWAMYMALQRFGTVTGDLLRPFEPGRYAGEHPRGHPRWRPGQRASTSPSSCSKGPSTPRSTIPPAASCTEQAYISAYDTGGSIPFNVINGQYVHVGTMVDPLQIQQVLAPAGALGNCRTSPGRRGTP